MCLDADDGVGQLPAGDLAAIPVYCSGQVEKASSYRDVGDIHGPDFIGTINLQPCQQIRVDFVAGMFLVVIGFPVESFDPYLFIRVEICFRATFSPSNLRRSLSIRAPTKGNSVCSLSISFIKHRAHSETTQLEHLGLVRSVAKDVGGHHLFVLRRPALLSAHSKKSFLMSTSQSWHKGS